MKTYQQIKSEHQKAIDNAINNCGVFFAFNEEQLKKGLKTLKKDDKVMSIFAGGFLPKSNKDKFFKTLEEATKQNKKDLKQLREEKEQAILYELKNYECFYTGELDSVIDLFKGIYTAKAIAKVYAKSK